MVLEQLIYIIRYLFLKNLMALAWNAVWVFYCFYMCLGHFHIFKLFKFKCLLFWSSLLLCQCWHFLLFSEIAVAPRFLIFFLKFVKLLYVCFLYLFVSFHCILFKHSLSFPFPSWSFSFLLMFTKEQRGSGLSLFPAVLSPPDSLTSARHSRRKRRLVAAFSLEITWNWNQRDNVFKMLKKTC